VHKHVYLNIPSPIHITEKSWFILTTELSILAGNGESAKYRKLVGNVFTRREDADRTKV